MLLNLHEQYTTEALGQIGNIDDRKAIEIIKGCFVNDLCELTNEYSEIHNTLEKYLEHKHKRKEESLDYKSLPKTKAIVDHIPLYQSHYGKLSVLHCMAPVNNQAPEDTQVNVLNWLNFLEFLVLNVDKDILNTNINEFQMILGEYVKDLKFNMANLLDTQDIFEAKYRSIGMIIHMIEDSYTVSHCKRESSGITTFYCYAEQSARIHRKSDFVSPEYKDQMINDIDDVLAHLLNNESAYNSYQRIFAITSLATPSSGGGFVEKD